MTFEIRAGGAARVLAGRAGPTRWWDRPELLIGWVAAASADAQPAGGWSNGPLGPYAAAST